jgi:predicted nucleotidyltransferase
VTASSHSRLTELQLGFLRAFMMRTSAFFLTGGAVLAGWELRHRHTDDLDLFTFDDEAMAEGDRLVRGAAAHLGAGVEALRTTPDFKRYLVRKGEEAVVIDLVRERVPALHERVTRDGIVTDSVEEIVANKICALVGRCETRDVVDLYFLERAGFRVEEYLEHAAKKDGGVTPATVAWVLSQFRITAPLPEGLSAGDLSDFVRDLERRMRRLAHPG